MRTRKDIDTCGLDDLVEQYLDRGMTPEDTAREISDVLDSLLPLGMLGPIGKVLEAVDGDILYAIILHIQMLRADPEVRIVRKLERAQRKEKRREERRKVTEARASISAQA